MPMGRSSSTSASSLPSSPVASSTNETWVTSTTLARKMSAVRRISSRCCGSAFTRMSISSRSTWLSSVRSLTLMTSISLWSCFVTCSMTNSSPLTTSVIRDTVGSRVSPTDRLSMLYPRAENSPATRAGRPNLFSTSTGIVCLRGSVPFMLIFLPGGPDMAPRPPSLGRAPAQPWRASVSPHDVSSSEPRLRFLGPVANFAGRGGQDHVRVGAPRRDHREDALVLVHAHVQDDRRRRAQHLLDGRHHLARLRHPQPDATVGLGQLHPVGDAGQVDRAVTLLVDDALPLPDHAVAAVVDDDRLHRELLDEARGQLLAVHREGAVAVDVDHVPAGVRGLHAHGRGQAVAHGAEPARGEPRPRVRELVVLGRPHLVLADAGDDHRLPARGVGDLLDHVLRLDDVVAPLVAERLLHLPLGDLRVPGLPALLAVAAGLRLLAHRLDERP